MFRDAEGHSVSLFDTDPEGYNADITFACWFEREIMARRESLWIGKDISLIAAGQVIGPGLNRGLSLQIPYGSFSELGITDKRLEQLVALRLVNTKRTSIRSKMAQAIGGIVTLDSFISQPVSRMELVEKDGSFEVPIAVIGYNPHRRLALPSEGLVPFVRFYLPSGILTGKELVEAVDTLSPDHSSDNELLLRNYLERKTTLADAKKLQPDDRCLNSSRVGCFNAVSIPITKHGYFEGDMVINAVDLDRQMDRAELDEILGIIWRTPYHFRTDATRDFYLGETAPVHFQGIGGTVLPGFEDFSVNSQWEHALSAIIDPGFGPMPIRIEALVNTRIGAWREMPSYVHLLIHRK